MKIGTTLSLTLAAAGLLALAAPANAQGRQHGGGNSGPSMNHGGAQSGGPRGGGMQGNNGQRGNFRDRDGFRRGGRHVNVFFGGFGFPFFGYPYYGYPYYGYGYGYPPYGYGYPGDAYYGYDPQGVYAGRVVRGGGRGSLTSQVQQQLAQAGYYHGAIDGIIGDGTRRAIRNYERANGLRVDGRIDNELLSTMGLG